MSIFTWLYITSALQQWLVQVLVEMCGLSDFQKGQIITVFTNIIAYTKHGKTSSAKKNSGQNLNVNDRDL